MTFTLEDLRKVWDELFPETHWPENQTRLVSIKILEDRLAALTEHPQTHPQIPDAASDVTRHEVKTSPLTDEELALLDPPSAPDANRGEE